MQKRIIHHNTENGFIEKTSISLEQKSHKCWRRFMNERAIDRAYIPTAHGIIDSCI